MLLLIYFSLGREILGNGDKEKSLGKISSTFPILEIRGKQEPEPRKQICILKDCSISLGALLSAVLSRSGSFSRIVPICKLISLPGLQVNDQTEGEGVNVWKELKK